MNPILCNCIHRFIFSFDINDISLHLSRILSNQWCWTYDWHWQQYTFFYSEKPQRIKLCKSGVWYNEYIFKNTYDVCSCLYAKSFASVLCQKRWISVSFYGSHDDRKLFQYYFGLYFYFSLKYGNFRSCFCYRTIPYDKHARSASVFY